jgi:hypothetical protein
MGIEFLGQPPEITQLLRSLSNSGNQSGPFPRIKQE